MLNKTMIMGRLTADVELRATQSGKSVAAFTVAVDRDFKGQNGERETDFINCVAWANTAEFMANYFKKGTMAVIVGRLQTRKFETNDGQKRVATEVIAENVYFGESKKETSAPPALPNCDDVPDLPEDDDLPF